MANVKPLGFQTYFLNLQQQNKEKSKDFEGTNQLNTNQISNGLIQLSFDSQGYLSSLTDLSTNKSYPIKQEFLYYIGYPNITGEQPSGMFVFRPYNNTPNSLTGPIQLSFVQVTSNCTIPELFIDI
uniref:Uncharacterized protein n=1 Tax=Acrobeloides nanus TaxID=290746 RepID=A0A914D6E4_9BILA